jgi:hypothetical protein
MNFQETKPLWIDEPKIMYKFDKFTKSDSFCIISFDLEIINED